MSEWNFIELKVWLEENRLGFAVEPFEEIDMNGDVFLTLAEEDFIAELVRIYQMKKANVQGSFAFLHTWLDLHVFS